MGQPRLDVGHFSLGFTRGLSCVLVTWWPWLGCLTTLHSSIWPLFPRDELSSIIFFCGHSLWQPSLVLFCVSSEFQEGGSEGLDLEVLEYRILHILLVKSVTGSEGEDVSLATMDIICLYTPHTWVIISDITATGSFAEICPPNNSLVTVSAKGDLVVIYLDCTVADITVRKWEIMSLQLTWNTPVHAAWLKRQ